MESIYISKETSNTIKNFKSELTTSPSLILFFPLPDDDKKLHRQELAFLSDEANRHLFPADTDDETSDLEGQARAEPIVTVSKFELLSVKLNIWSFR